MYINACVEGTYVTTVDVAADPPSGIPCFATDTYVFNTSTSPTLAPTPPPTPAPTPPPTPAPTPPPTPAQTPPPTPEPTAPPTISESCLVDVSNVNLFFRFC
jgi:hypothetical protein